MRALLAATFFLLGLGSALPESEFNALIEPGADSGLPSVIEIESASRRASQHTAAEAPANVTTEEMPHLDTVELPLEPINPDVVSKHASFGELCDALFTSARNAGLPVQFLANLIWQESGLRNNTVSRAGALGIAQFMPQTAKENGLNDPFDPHQAIPASAKLLQQLRDQFGNLGFAAAAYNAGPHRVSDWLASGHVLPRETLDYVLRVTGRSADQWRTAPPPEATLTFTQELPCRTMPAFASLEQSQAQQAPVEPPPQVVATSSDDQKTKAAPPPQALNIADRDESNHRASKHERQAAHEKAKSESRSEPKSEHGRKLADARESRNRRRL